jgi:hypothetical protein
MNVRYLIPLTLTIVTCSVLTVHAQELQSKEPRLPQNSKEWEQAERARRETGIKTAASLYGRYKGEEPFGTIQVAGDATTLAWQSDLVVVGRVLEASSQLSTDERHISTEHKVVIDRVLKSETPVVAGTLATVTVPGGQLTFENGATAVTTPRNLRQSLEVGKQYLLFLEASQLPVTPQIRATIAPLGRYSIAYGPQGVFEIRSTAGSLALHPNGSPENPVGQEMASIRSVDQMVAKVAQAVKAAQAYPAREKPEARQP